MDRSLSHRPDPQAVLDLYGYSDRVQIVAALNEERLRHRTAALVRQAVRRLHRTPRQQPAQATCAAC